MEKIRFVDAAFKELPEKAQKSQRYAVDLGIRPYQFGREKGDFHLFCLLEPVARNQGWYKVWRFLTALRRLNEDVKFAILDSSVYDLLCKAGIRIDNAWIESDADYWGEEADIYVVFGFAPDAEFHPIVLF